MVVDKTVYDGRPADTAGRPEKEVRCYDALDQLGIAYKRVDHAPMYTMEAGKAVEQILQIEICKNLFLCNRQKTEFYLLLMEGDKVFKTKALSGLLGVSRLSFAPPERMEALLDVTPGSASILSLMNDKENRVRLLIDRPVIEKPFFGCHPCNNTSSLCIKTADIMEKFLPSVHHVPEIVELPDIEETV